jgi:hypothetical protein
MLRETVLWQVHAVAVKRVFVIRIKRVHCKVQPEAEEKFEHSTHNTT